MKLKISLLLAAIFFLGNCKANTLEFEKLLEDAYKGSKIALYTIGNYYSNGVHVKQNNEEAIKYYYKAAIQNYAPAQNNLGWALRQGLGVKKNPIKAIYWFRLSALQNNALALQNLAEMYQSGEGVAINNSYVESLYTLCATQVLTKNNLGRETGYNNAIHECRREMGKITATKVEHPENALSLAAFWFRASLAKNSDALENDAQGIAARRSLSETTALLAKVEAQLSKKNKDWVTNKLKKWEAFRDEAQDSTSFPLTVIDMECSNTNEKI